MAETGELVPCYNKGCGQKFDKSKGDEETCRYHPGVPVFHDALKGWSCCKKRSTDFTEFLNIPGCTAGKHSNEKPSEAVKPDVTTSKEPVKEKTPEPQGPRQMIQTPMVDPVVRPSEDEPMMRLPCTVGATLKQALEKQMSEMSLNANASATGDEPNAVKIGESCKHNNCNKTYTGESSNSESCVHHPGGPVFHEGMKYWSCCQRKTSDFNNFLNQEGCETGKHCWVKKEDSNKKVACRVDWHQTTGMVIISIFSKVAIPEESWVEVNKVKVKAHIVFDQGKSVFDQEFVLRGIIDPSKSNVKMLGAKVEINMKKADAGSWPTLEVLPKEGKEQ